MSSDIMLRAACAIAAALLVAATAYAQEDKLAYVLTRARVNVDRPECRSTIVRQNASDATPPCREIEVLFGKSFPDSEAAENPDNWLVFAVNADGQRQTFSPRRVQANITEKLVLLEMGEDLNPGGRLDRATHRIVIIYQQQNLPTVTLGLPQKRGPQKIFTAAKGKKDADIYFSGMAVGQRKSGPLYSIDAKAGYLQSLGRAGAIGGLATLVSEEGSDVDPDSITVAGAYQKVFVFRSPTGIILNSEFLGFESDKEGKTRNLSTEVDATLVLPSARLSPSTGTFATMDFMAGFEAGHNYEHPLNPNGLGNFWRPKVGVNAYLVMLRPKVFNRVNLSANYIARFPQSAEPFTEKIDGAKITSLTKRLRHHLGIDLGLMFAPSYGLTIKYRYGSLPPAFNFVDHKVSVGFTLQLKQANK